MTTIKEAMAKVIAVHCYWNGAVMEGTYATLPPRRKRAVDDCAQAILDMPEVKALVDAAYSALNGAAFKHPQIKQQLSTALTPFEDF